jgi:aspyridone synthetase (hybrid polyketide synthase/nonribosomal peptide synthetase)
MELILLALVTVDTACSSSLVALHQAVQGLRNGEADQAIVAGVNLLLDPSMYITESTLHMLSQESRCRMWDKEANGYARGEGCGVVVLKPLSKAIADDDHIECVIRETGVNSDGRTNGITMPSAEAQAELIRKTYERAGLDAAADGCQFFECHGTGRLSSSSGDIHHMY